MKKILIGLGAALLAVGCSQAPQKSMIHAELSGLDVNDSVLVICGETKDTLAAPNGVFAYEYTDSVAGMVRFHKLPKLLPNGRMEAFSMRPLVVMMFPHQTVKVKGSMDSYEVTGSDFYQEYNAATAMLSEADQLRRAKNDDYMKVMSDTTLHEGKAEAVKAAFDQVRAADSVYQDKVAEYVGANLNSDAALFLLYLNRAPKGETLVGQFAEKVKQGELKNFYQDLVEYYEVRAARRAAAALVQPGMPAPEFTAKDIDGNDFSLSSLKGKYVVLDFWGSWCGWCIKGFPEMKEMYKKYQGKLEVVGVDCRDTEDKWKAAVEKHALPWINVINNTEKGKDISVNYNVGGFPTKVIISPEGNIVEVVVGEKPEFYETIKDLMK